jgi:acid phosphatase type 7
MGRAELDHSLSHWVLGASRNTTTLVGRDLESTDLVLHVGDIAYSVGYGTQVVNHPPSPDTRQWDEFMAQIEPIAARVPYMTAIGNHERDFPASGSKYPVSGGGGGWSLTSRRVPTRGGSVGLRTSTASSCRARAATSRGTLLNMGRRTLL